MSIIKKIDGELVEFNFSADLCPKCKKQSPIHIDFGLCEECFLKKYNNKNSYHKCSCCKKTLPTNELNECEECFYKSLLELVDA